MWKCQVPAWIEAKDKQRVFAPVFWTVLIAQNLLFAPIFFLVLLTFPQEYKRTIVEKLNERH